jgi:uncharacterized integral membrane protein
MTKFKALWLLVSGALLAIFVIQNWQFPNPPIHFLGFQFLPFPQSVIILGFFVLGFLTGWLTHVFRVRKSQQETPSEQDRAT